MLIALYFKKNRCATRLHGESRFLSDFNPSCLQEFAAAVKV